MLEVICLDSDGNSISCFNQWDSYQKIIIDGMNFTTAPEVHFCNRNSENAIRVSSVLLDDGQIKADVPNVLLLEPLNLIIYVYTLTDNGDGNTSGRTVQIAEIPVRTRKKPSGFLFKENIEVVQLGTLIKNVSDLQNGIIESEKIRNDNENERKNNEEIRVANESLRVQNENNRQQSVSSMISDMQDALNDSAAALASSIQATSDSIVATTNANNASASANEAAQKANEAYINAESATKSANEAAKTANEYSLNAKNISEAIQTKANNGDFSSTIKMGKVETGKPGTNAIVKNVGTDKDLILDFTIPRGDTGSIDNVNDTVVDFTAAETNENIASGDSFSTLFGKIQKMFSDIPSLIDGAILNSHPIGSIYVHTENINPSTFIGGEWVAWGSGRVPVGVDENQTEFNGVEKTGGAKSHTLSVDELPSHSHQVGAHSHGLNSHTHTIPAQTVTSGIQSANHTHTYSGTTSNPSPTLTGSIWNVASQNASISYSASGIVSVRSANESHGYAENTVNNGTDGYTINATHTHTYSGTTVTNNNNHTHSVTIPQTTSGQAVGSTANSAAFNTESAGGGNAHNNLPPYITCYMWKRVA